MYTDNSKLAMPMLVFVYLLRLSIGVNCGKASNGMDIVDRLFEHTMDLQVKKSTTLKPFIEAGKIKGNWKSDIKLNIHGPWEEALVRKDLNIMDNSMFVTAWVTICLLEANIYGGGPSPTDQQLGMALTAISQFKAKNRAYPNSLMSFWPQVYNKTSKVFETVPPNLSYVHTITEDLFLQIKDLLKLLGLNEAEEIYNYFMKLKLALPPDFDDTFVNLGLGALLSEHKSAFSNAHAQWSGENTNLTSIFDALKHYAYRPFSTERRINTIDPRTYFYLRHFLEGAKSDNSDVALVSTWAQDVDETRYMYYNGNVMPYNVNNVDVTVSANVIYGITSSVLSGLVPADILDDPDVQQIYLNTTSMIAFEIQTNLTDRRDLALTYYPSLFEFYWFVARSLFILENTLQKGPLPHKALKQVHRELSGVLRSYATQHILKAGISDGGQMYFDDFLGDADVTKDNKPLTDAEDRIFTTAMAANALIQTWSVFDSKTKKIFWIAQAPRSVKDAVRKSISWLEKNTLSGKYKPWNVFFSFSEKSHESIPFWFPGNILEYLNGTKFSNEQHFPSSAFILGIKGSVPESVYTKLCKEKHFGQKTPMDFHGFNVKNGFFSFWSSDAMTYSSTLLAISQYRNLHDH